MSNASQGARALEVVAEREVLVYDLDSGVDPRRAARRGPAPSPIAGLVRRIPAFCLDAMVLVAIGVAIGRLWGDHLAVLGKFARLVGAAVTAAYFGILGSRWGLGQTLGKRLLRIRVVGRDGQPLSPLRSLARVGTLLMAFGWGGAPFLSSPVAGQPGLLATVAFQGLGGAILYLLLFNRRSRQSVHDLAAGSWVVNAQPLEARALPRTSRRQRIVVVAWCALVLCAGLLGLRSLNRQQSFRQLSAIRQSIAESLPVRRVRVAKHVEQREGRRGSVRPVHALDVSMVLVPGPHTFDVVANEAAQIALSAPPDGRVDVLTVTVARGYDMLISRNWKRRIYSFPASEWHRRNGNFDNPHRAVTSR